MLFLTFYSLLLLHDQNKLLNLILQKMDNKESAFAVAHEENRMEDLAIPLFELE